MTLLHESVPAGPVPLPTQMPSRRSQATPTPAVIEPDMWQRIEIGPFTGCYLVWSRTNATYAYLMDADGTHRDEGCTAASFGRSCWHRALVLTLEEQRIEAAHLAAAGAASAPSEGTQWDEPIASRATPPAACLEPERPALRVVRPDDDPFEASYFGLAEEAWR